MSYTDAQRRGRTIRRARMRGRGDRTVTKKALAALLIAQHKRCNICLDYITVDSTIDHIIPLKLGGAHVIKNIQLLCRPCNLKKQAKLPEGLVIGMRSFPF